MFDSDSESVMQEAVEEAANRGHEFVTLEHLLYALIQNPKGAAVVRGCGGDLPNLKRKLEDFFSTKLERTPLPRGREPHQTIAFQRVLQRSILHAEYSSGHTIAPGDLLAAILTESESHSSYFLNQEGISRLDVLEYISHGSDMAFDAESGRGEEDGFPAPDGVSEQKGDPLEKYAVNLNERAEQGLIDPLIGREKEIERTVHILSRRNKNNPLYVGDQGVGKTAIAEGLAQRVVDGEVPKKLKNMTIYSLDLGALLAGTRFRGDFEERLKGVLKALEKKPDAVLFIDEIHTIIGAGATSGGTMDAANLLKPVLTRGNLRFIGSTTFEEYKNHFEKDKALARRFLKIDVNEPTVEETIEILKGLRSRLEDHHEVHYSPAAIRAAAELSAKYVNERFLPDKAIDVLDEAGAVVSLRAERSEAEESQEDAAANESEELEIKTTKPTVKVSHIEKIVADIARIPTRTVSTSDREKLKELDVELKKVVFGQDDAIAALTLAIRRARAGLISDAKPIGSFLFAGPTGVGKTEVAKQLAKVLGLELVRFDMSEYMEKHTVARLIGAPPGYVGFEQGGLLTDAIIRQPYSVLLLDEIEKAHPDLFNIMLQVMDNASLTDNNGRKADFRNVIIIMTSNVGSESIHGSTIGFTKSEQGVGQGAIDKMFRPEFRNRLDAVIKFKPLSTETMELVVDKFIVDIDRQLLSRKATISVTAEARRWLAQRGHEPQYGARSIHRFIQREVKDKLADELLFGKLSQGGTVTVSIDDDKLTFTFTPPPEGAKRKGKATASV